MGVLKITRESLADKIFLLANNDIWQQLFPPFVAIQMYAQSNGIIPWTLGYTHTEGALSLFGLGPTSSGNTLLSHLLTLGNDIGQYA